jgi:WD40-like Beta Propeller Repeat
MSRNRRSLARRGYSLAATVAATLISAPLHADRNDDHSQWTTAVTIPELNSPQADGCPIESEDGLSIFIASPRAETLGFNDIWAADRDSIDSPWGTPRNLGAPINTAFADFCPTPVMGRYLFFVSERPGDVGGPAPCGSGDMYLARQSPAGGWSTPQMLPCAPEGPNTTGGERSPSLVQTWYGTFLFYSTNGGSANQDIYVSKLGADGAFGPGILIAALSTAQFDDIMPNVRVREDGALEMVFSSNRTTWGHNQPAAGGQDVYVAYSWWPTKGWTSPQNLGKAVNTSGVEQRATLSHDGKRLYFGRDGDIFTSNRMGRRRKH